MGFLSFLTPFIAPILGIGSSALSNSSSEKISREAAAASLEGIREQNATNIQLAKEGRDFTERLSNTAVQRRADDLAKAGFNPILSATGASATTPGATTATVQNTKAGVATAKLAHAQNVARLGEQISNTFLTAAQNRKTNAETRIIDANLSSAKAAEAIAKLKLRALTAGTKKIDKIQDFVSPDKVMTTGPAKGETWDQTLARAQRENKKRWGSPKGKAPSKTTNKTGIRYYKKSDPAYNF